MNKQITVNYGTQSYTHTFTSGVTVSDVAHNSTIKAVLGFGDNVRILLSGVEQPGDLQLSNGAVLTVETRANSKAN